MKVEFVQIGKELPVAKRRLRRIRNYFAVQRELDGHVPANRHPLRLRFRWRVTAVLCILVTNGRHWWGRPFTAYDDGPIRRRCRFCRTSKVIDWGKVGRG